MTTVCVRARSVNARAAQASQNRELQAFSVL